MNRQFWRNEKRISALIVALTLVALILFVTAFHLTALLILAAFVLPGFFLFGILAWYSVSAEKASLPDVSGKTWKERFSKIFKSEVSWKSEVPPAEMLEPARAYASTPVPLTRALREAEEVARLAWERHSGRSR
ncbi:MAG TPA: hypothetical protein VH186_09940 [Chloroflexia bacterium]|nr:hypothetical protein [Chloroflexia bacterium]